MNELELTGRARTHIVDLVRPRCALHYAAAGSFLAMRDAAAVAGLDLAAASSFRDFDRQLHIWNAKWRGERPLLDRGGRPLDTVALDEAARIDAILCWSALSHSEPCPGVRPKRPLWCRGRGVSSESHPSSGFR